MTEDSKGYIHDVGGPAGFDVACNKQMTRGACADKKCLTKPCPAMVVIIVIILSF